MLNTCEDLISVWESKVAARPEAVALICEDGTWTRQALDQRTRAYGAWLLELGLNPGDRVVLMLDNGPNFLALFLGCQRIGVVPVPLSPKSPSRRVAYVVADCSCERVLLDPSHLIPSLVDVPGMTPLPKELPEGGSGTTTPSHLALIQYTSGSTSDSKGVMVSQGAVLANIAGFSSVMGLGPESCFSSLLPLFHDMGLVCFGLTPLLLGHTLILHRQEALSLYQWLEAIGTHRVTHTGGPDSLMRIACRVVDDPGRYDLASLQMFICGSEPVLGATLEAFGDKFGVRDILRPAYGMAELTLCATLTPEAEPWRRDAQGRVSSGRPIAGVEVRIKPSSGLGEIWVKSVACMDGYWGRKNEFLSDDQGFMSTGDLGYQDEDGHLYVMGRLKNLLIRAGAKFNPHDLEAAAQRNTAVRRAAVVQPSLAQDEEDPVVAVLEVDRLLLKDFQALESLARGVRRACATEAGLAPDVIWYVKGGHIPTTENGKLRHRILAEAIQCGQFRPEWSFPALSETVLPQVFHAV